MKNNLLVTFCSFLFTVAVVQAQLPKNTISVDNNTSYILDKNDLDEGANLLVSVVPLAIYFATPDFNLAVMPAVTYRLPGDKLFVDAYFKYAYAEVKDKSYNTAAQNGLPVDKIKNQTSFGDVITYNFKNVETEHRTKVWLAS